jgi:hypothetical protein
MLLNALNGDVGFHDADFEKIWRISKTVNDVITDFLFADVANTAGIENILTTLKVKKVGNTYTFSIVRSGAETILGSFNIDDFPSFSSVVLWAWTHNIPVNAKADNFRYWTDTAAPTCTPVQ